MIRRLLLIVAVLVALAAIAFWALRPGGFARKTTASLTPAPAPTPTPAPETRVMLLFPGTDGALHPELRTVPLPAELNQRVRVIVSQLLAGPTARLLPVAGYPAQLLDVFIDGRGNAFVDLSSPPQPLTGSFNELMLAYSIVDSVLLNCQELKGVQLLFDDHEVQTLTGHLDLSRPLALNKSFIAAQ